MDAEKLDGRLREFLARSALEAEACRRSGVYYLENYVWTVDEHRQDDSEQPLLHGAPWLDPETLLPMRELDGSTDDYLRYAAALWMAEPLTLYPKSRQLRMTHLMVNLHGWLAQFYPGQRIAVQSKNSADADALLERRWKSMEIERRLFPFIDWPRAKRTQGRIVWEHGSIMMAIAQGAEKVRSYTFSAIMSDEMAFQDAAEDAYTAAIPTIEGGGKYTGISSANPGFFETMVFDKAKAA